MWHPRQKLQGRRVGDWGIELGEGRAHALLGQRHHEVPLHHSEPRTGLGAATGNAELANLVTLPVARAHR